MLYFNTQEKIVAFDPVTKNKLEFEVEGYEDMLFYSSYVDEGKIYLYGREDYYGEDFLFEEPFEKNFTVTWNCSSGTYEQKYMIGDIPSFEGNLDDIYVDDDFHNTFSNWDKAFTPLLNDTVFNAEYTPEEKDLYINICKNRFGLDVKLMKDERYMQFTAESSRQIDSMILNNIPNEK